MKKNNPKTHSYKVHSPNVTFTIPTVVKLRRILNIAHTQKKNGRIPREGSKEIGASVISSNSSSFQKDSPHFFSVTIEILGIPQKISISVEDVNKTFSKAFPNL